MTRAERRYRRNAIINKRVRLSKALGLQGGLLYEKHRNKISQASGYFAKGVLRHYVATRPRKYYDRYKLEDTEEIDRLISSYK